jgi:PAS domain S-box-containing protein
LTQTPRIATEEDDGLDVLWEDGERVFRRVRRSGVDGNRNSVLFVRPSAQQPHPSLLDRLAHEYALRDELDSAWSLRPLELVSDGGRPMLVLEAPGGEPLHCLLAEPLEIGSFLRLAVRIAAALGKVHQRGLVHKDIRPHNIIVNRATGDVKLTGFGFASRLPRERQAPEPPETIAGTLAYMAPEQTGRMNRSVDSRSDLYALGVAFYEMLTGGLPFAASDPMEWVHCHIARKPMPPSERLESVPIPVSQIIMKLLAKTAEERYQTAAGLGSDLQHCLAEWDAQGRIDDFPLGKHDTPDWLLIPEKLYGRERELEILLASFDRIVKDGAPELVLVSGYSGIGKSSVVNELHKVLVPPRGLFASGKFDQYKREIPYATLAQAFQSLVRGLLAKSEADLAPWRDALREALGSNGRLMVDLVPELRLIIGEQPPIPELSPQDAQLHFQLVFRRFIGVFARPEHPLALFLDDLQWLDAATLDLLEDWLTRSGQRHLLLVGAYRDNEVDAAHPLIRKLEAVRKAGAIVQEISLTPLAREHVGQLMTDALCCEPALAAPLVQLVHDKTAGNPFFVIQFLSSLVEEGVLAFDHDVARWCWDLSRIHAKGYTDNLVDLMVERLKRLPPSSQDALKQLACLGNNTDISTLEIVLGVTEAEIHESLRAAVQSGTIVSQGAIYRFLHDRVQEAAYALIPEKLRPALHYRIGHRLLAGRTEAEITERIFDIVNQLNLGALPRSDPDEKARIARLNLQAGLRAKASTAYASACSYFAFGLALLGDDGWAVAYDLTFKLMLERAECELLCANQDLSAELIEDLLLNARSKLDRTEGFRVKIMLQLLHADMALAARTALECLKMFGMTFPEHPTDEDVREEYEDLQRRMGSRPIESLIDLPLMQDPEIRALSSIIFNLCVCSYHVNEKLFNTFACRIVKLSIEYGQSEACALGYGCLAVSLGPDFDRFEDGERLARVAVALSERHGFLAQRTGTQFLLQMALLWTHPIDEVLRCLDAADQAAAQAGEVVFACYSAEHRITNLLARGDPLDLIWPELVKGLTLAQEKRYAMVIDTIGAIQRFISALRADSPGARHIDTDETILLRTGLPIVQCYYWTLQLQLRYLMSDPAGALAAAEKAKPVFWSARRHIQAGTFVFYHALTLAAVIRASAPTEQGALRHDLEEGLAALRKLAGTGPHTYAHKHLLVAAEVARLEGNDLDAMRLYERAVRSAAEKGFIHEAALGAELAAEFFCERGLENIAQSYLREARDGYSRWGAHAKVALLDRRHPETAPPVSQVHLPTIGAPVEHLDLGTVIKVSQAVSREIVFEKLIDTLMRTAIEHAGAERAVLILARGAAQRITAEAMTSGDAVIVHLRDEAVAETVLPESVLHYVARTNESVILDDAVTPNPFSADPYIRQHQVRSILCLPLLNAGKLIGVIYLENNLAPRVFASARITVLKLLASQAAISLDNTRLYRDLAEREAKIRRLVDANIIGIFIWDLDGRILEPNDAFLRIVGYDRHDLATGLMRWTDLSPPEWLDHNVRQELPELKRTGILPPFEKEFFHKDGSRVPVLLGAATFGEKGDQGVAFVLDLTERKRAEAEARASERRYREVQAELAHANRVATMGQLTASIAHEIRQPLSSAKLSGSTALRWLTRNPPEIDEAKQSIENAVKDTNRANDVINRIHSFVKKAAPSKERLNINEAILEVVALTRAEALKHRVTTQMRLADNLPQIQGDRVQLQQVMINLIINAVQAMSDAEGARELHISTEHDVSEGVHVTVRDTGPGLTVEKLSDLFEPFYTTKPGGMGMGLSICRSIVEEHAGRLWASANAPRGAIFHFTLPIPSNNAL